MCEVAFSSRCHAADGSVHCNFFFFLKSNKINFLSSFNWEKLFFLLTVGSYCWFSCHYSHKLQTKSTKLLAETFLEEHLWVWNRNMPWHRFTAPTVYAIWQITEFCSVCSLIAKAPRTKTTLQCVCSSLLASVCGPCWISVIMGPWQPADEITGANLYRHPEARLRSCWGQTHTPMGSKRHTQATIIMPAHCLLHFCNSCFFSPCSEERRYLISWLLHLVAISSYCNLTEQTDSLLEGFTIQ